MSIVLLCGCGPVENDRSIDEHITLEGNDRSAMGGYVFKYLAGKSFIDSNITDNKFSFDKWHNNLINEDEVENNNVYFIVTPRLSTYKKEALAMAEFVGAGNTLFVAANYFDPFFLEQFSMGIQDDISILSSPAAFKMRDTKQHLTDSITFPINHFSFFFYPNQKSISVDSTMNWDVMGRNDFESPDLVRIKYGDGELVVMTNIQVCTNYFLLTGNNYHYALGAFSYLPAHASHIYWDEFYSRYDTRPAEGSSMFKALLAIPGLNGAFWIILIAAAIWLITNLWRKQRVIPVIAPNTNSSLEFTQTIARLYFNQKDNKDIAQKMITYLQDHIRNKYFINYASKSEHLEEMLAAKTGLSTDKMKDLVQTVEKVKQQPKVDDITLLTLNHQIQEVMKAGA